MTERAYVLAEDIYIKPSSRFPGGSWLRRVDGEVMVATGWYAQWYPDKPSPYVDGKAPFVVIDWGKS